MWAIVRDISERKAAERRQREADARLRELSAGLERTVAERTAELRESRAALMNLVDDLNARTAELRESNERLLGLDRLKSLFIATMSHELRTPLNSIIGFTGILLQGMAGPLGDEQRLQLGMVRASSEHLLALITDIIDLGKIEAGRIDLERRTFDLASLAGEVLASFRIAAAQKGLALTAETGPPRPVHSDPRRVRQVLVNLVGNAVKFTDAGEVRVVVSGREGGGAAVAVGDTGPGIPHAEQWRLFQPFSRIVGGEFARHEGTGLGLYLSQKLAGVLGGTIDVRSEPGRGSVFTFTLPAHAGEERA
jgi:signal transduction histidine kinase